MPALPPSAVLRRLAALCALLAVTDALAQTPDEAGVLDVVPSELSRQLVLSPEQLQEQVQREQSELESLDRNALETRAEAGERVAQVALGADFAKEATLLGFAPAAANDALSDAARWYSLAASRGFPGAPSLDQAGVRFYPIRIQREPVRR